MARNKAIAEAKAIDLSPVKVLIIGAGPTGPQHLQSSLTRAESIFTEADTEQKRKRGKQMQMKLQDNTAGLHFSHRGLMCVLARLLPPDVQH